MQQLNSAIKNMITVFVALVVGLVLLVWSADRFVEGAAATAYHFGMPSLLIGMVIVGFGTSAPEMVVSALSASQGNPGIALGNAYGSNITNIALILGLTSVISPIMVHSQVLRKEFPLLLAVTALAAWQISDGEVSRLDAWVMLILFGGLMTWTIRQGIKKSRDMLGVEMKQELSEHDMSLSRAILWLVIGFICLVLSSRMLVWGGGEPGAPEIRPDGKFELVGSAPPGIALEQRILGSSVLVGHGGGNEVTPVFQRVQLDADA